jgi:hypothetical protein
MNQVEAVHNGQQTERLISIRPRDIGGLPRGASAMTTAAGRVSTTLYGNLTTSKRRQDLARLLEGPGEEPIK